MDGRLGLNVQPTNETEILEARIPSFKGNDDKKVEYLSYRAVGFSVKESLQLSEVKSSSLRSWRENDIHFRDFERDRKNLRELQRSAAKDVLEAGFKRNFLLLLKKDAFIIEKSMKTMNIPMQGDVDGMELLTDREWSYLQMIRKYYTPDQYLQLSKALEPDKHQDNKILVLQWDGRSSALPSPEAYGISVEVIDESNGNNGD